MNFGAYKGVKLLEHAMKIVEKLLERRMRLMVKVDEMQFGFMPGKGTIDAVFILRRLQEEYLDKEKKLYMHFVDLEKALNRFPRRVLEWAMRKRGIPETMVRIVMSLYGDAKTRSRVGLELSEEFKEAGIRANSVVCVKCRKWIHGRCAKVKRVTLRLGRDFVCGRCKKQADEFMDSVEELCEEVETVRGFCYLGDKVNGGGGCEAAVTARARIGWVKFRECGELLNSKRFSLKLKGMVYRSCVRSVK
ncbi:PREDICTED: uncharacterized protein LOC107354102 [Acropora digitifera]|uniref:uncharacterized protein LOC107354102 n=1 Tax=Acropora digitifera TaxID=70779 RepID=UPI00077A0F71|nr:PREDICTED: uncharacterized protein LOC107354102 [Acropora digitifera]